MSMMTKAFERSRAMEASVHSDAIQAKAAGRLIAPSTAMGQLASYQMQGAHRERYGLFKGWLYSAVNAIASKAAAQPVQVGKMKNMPAKQDEGKKPARSKTFITKKMSARMRTKASRHELEVLESHPILDTLEKPNPMQGRWQFVYSFVANLCLTGWSFVVKDGKEYYSLPTTWITPKHDTGPFSSIEIRNPADPESEAITIKRGNFAFAHLPNPSNPLAAIAPASTQLPAIRIDDHIQASQERFFENGIFPSVIVTMGKDPHPEVPGGMRPRLSAVQRRQVHAAISKVMGGVSNYGAPAIVDGLIESIERLSATQNEMGWEKSEQTIKTRILSAFGVHQYILGESVNVGGYAQVANIEKQFFQRVNTYLDMLSDLMTNFAAPSESNDRLLVWWEECEVVDPSVYWSNMNAARARGDVTQSEYRALLNLPPDEDGVNAQIDPAQMAIVVQLMQAAGSGAITPIQAQAAFVGMGISEELAEELAGDGPQQQLDDATGALNGAVGALNGEQAKPNKPKKPKPGEAEAEVDDEEEIDKEAKKMLRMIGFTPKAFCPTGIPPEWPE